MINNKSENDKFNEAMAELEALPIILSEDAAISICACAVSEKRSAIDIASRILNQWGEREMGVTRRILDSLDSINEPDEAGEQRSAQRRAMTPSIRLAVLQRDGHKCISCGATSDDSKLHVDHIVPVVAGGKTIIENLQCLCADCNLAKGQKLVSFPGGRK